MIFLIDEGAVGLHWVMVLVVIVIVVLHSIDGGDASYY